MYAITGPCLVRQEEMLGADLLSSKGQNGGGLTFTESGILFGIYNDVEDETTSG